MKMAVSGRSKEKLLMQKNLEAQWAKAIYAV